MCMCLPGFQVVTDNDVSPSGRFPFMFVVLSMSTVVASVVFSLLRIVCVVVFDDALRVLCSFTCVLRHLLLLKNLIEINGSTIQEL